MIFVTVLLSCKNESRTPWPWWTKQDSIAVQKELNNWRDTLNGSNFIRQQNGSAIPYLLSISVPIVKTDTAPRSQPIDSIVKIAHFLGFSNTLGNWIHNDELTFGRKNDTNPMRDTFCYVTYTDSTSNCIGVLRYDSIWTIKFYPETTITPTETIITYRAYPPIKTGLPYTTEEQNIYSLAVMRKLELKKDSAATIYRLRNLTGFGTYVPNTTYAPAISYIILTRPGKTDTFRYSPRSDGKGIYNLKHKDSLYSVAVGESIEVNIITTTPADTLTDYNYFFISSGAPFVTTKYHVTKSTRTGKGKIAFAQTGLGHLYVEVIPASTLFYPFDLWRSTVWALPIRVKP